MGVCLHWVSSWHLSTAQHLCLGGVCSVVTSVQQGLCSGLCWFRFHCVHQRHALIPVCGCVLPFIPTCSLSREWHSSSFGFWNDVLNEVEKTANVSVPSTAKACSVHSCQQCVCSIASYPWEGGRGTHPL